MAESNPKKSAARQKSARNPGSAKLQTFNDLIAPHSKDVRVVAKRLRQLVREVAPDAIEQIDSAANLVGYGFAQTYKDTICVIMPLKAAVNLGFPRGVELPDPAGSLTGTGKRARHVKITTVEEVEAPAVRALLEAAVEQLSRNK